MNLCQAVNKAYAQDKGDALIPEMIVDLAMDSERPRSGNDDLFDLSPLGIVNLLDMRQRERAARGLCQDLDKLIHAWAKVLEPRHITCS